MNLPDDCAVTPSQLKQIRKHALNALQDADALGRFPTPISDVMAAAEVDVCEEHVFTETFLRRIRKRAGSALKSALSKVIGLLDSKSRLIYLDRTLLAVKQTFIKLHETAHAILPWQKNLYVIVEDCKLTLDPEISEEFDREANIFASEVLFQLDSFTQMVADDPFGIKVPIAASKKYGASIYATIRRYVTTNHRACAVVVINPPEMRKGDGFVATRRRVVVSREFNLMFGNIAWPEYFTPDDEIGVMIPILGRKMSKARSFGLCDCDGVMHECIGEAFTNTHQVFILILVAKTLKNKIVCLS